MNAQTKPGFYVGLLISDLCGSNFVLKSNASQVPNQYSLQDGHEFVAYARGYETISPVQLSVVIDGLQHDNPRLCTFLEDNLARVRRIPALEDLSSQWYHLQLRSADIIDLTDKHVPGTLSQISGKSYYDVVDAGKLQRLCSTKSEPFFRNLTRYIKSLQ
jgi:hypothetical protein